MGNYALPVRVTLCDVGPRDGLQNEPEALAPSVRAELVGPTRCGRPASDRGGELRSRRPRAADGGRGGGRRAQSTAAGRALGARPQRARLGALHGDVSRPRQRHVRGDGDLQPSQRQHVARGRGRPGRGHRGHGRGLAPDSDDLGRVRLPVRGPRRPGRRCRAGGARSPAAPRSCSPTRSASRRRRTCAALVERTGAEGFHGHNTRNTGYANALAAIEAGAWLLDASVGGLGGCPYAPKATGNIATEDLVYLLEGEGIETGVDLDALIPISRWLEELLGRRLEGYVYRAGGGLG